MRTNILKHIFCIIAFLLTCIIVEAQPTISSISPISVKPGDIVTIVGSSFAGPVALTDVYFGNAKATYYTSASFNTLIVTVPIGATNEPIPVNNKTNKISYE